jgi:hypothetical protein
MDSLKKYSERLAPLMNTTPSALNERQRQLVRLGLLKAPDKTGPGAGIRATQANVAMLLLTYLVTDNLSEMDARIGKIARTRPRTGHCPLTGATTFGDAITRILFNPGIAGDVTGVTLHRTEGTAEVGFLKNNLILQSIFGGSKERPSFEVWALLSGRVLATIAKDLQEEE